MIIPRTKRQYKTKYLSILQQIINEFLTDLIFFMALEILVFKSVEIDIQVAYVIGKYKGIFHMI